MMLCLLVLSFKPNDAAVLVGRPIVGRLAVGGTDGVREVLSILREEFDTALALVRAPTVADVTRDLVA